ncbi:hypothetical protein J4476_00100 [Candidatus Woesearchaeota archaeon]|nr:hypothetical protein [Candidatus Woesearchaeota archaeon]HIH25493.1 hypothetical protein [Nanoarchaeota archaeon]
MIDEYFKDSVKNSFSKVKDDICRLDDELRLQREVLSKQNDILRLLNNKLSSIIEKIDEIEKKMPKIESENMSNQSINQLINHLITYQSLNHEEASNEPIKAKKDVSIRNDGVNQSFNQIINHQSDKNEVLEAQDLNFQALKTNIDSTFRALSKQELKVFLTVYQLEDEGKIANYTNIAQNLGLSEHCIRSHISFLMKKNAPLVKQKLNNKRNLLSIRKDFKALNLKQRLINVYYESDPHQTTLFDIK